MRLRDKSDWSEVSQLMSGQEPEFISCRCEALISALLFLSGSGNEIEPQSRASGRGEAVPWAAS